MRESVLVQRGSKASKPCAPDRHCSEKEELAQREERQNIAAWSKREAPDPQARHSSCEPENSLKKLLTGSEAPCHQVHLQREAEDGV